MGPAAWSAVGRAMGLALASSLFNGPNNIANIVIKEIHRSLINKDIETARGMLRDLAWRHRESFKSFMDKYSDELPYEAVEEFNRILNQS